MDASRNDRDDAHENGAVESQNRYLKTAIKQAPILRGSRDFAGIENDRRFVDMPVARCNRQRAAAIQAERAHLKPLPQRRTTDFTEILVAIIRTGDGVDASLPDGRCGAREWKEAFLMKISIIGVDPAKNVFQLTARRRTDRCCSARS